MIVQPSRIEVPDRIRKRLDELEKRLGGELQARMRVCAAMNKSERTFHNWIQKGIPTANDTVAFALACGFSEDEAWEMAREHFSIAAQLPA
jgi:hypothetical protein